MKEGHQAPQKFPRNFSDGLSLIVTDREQTGEVL